VWEQPAGVLHTKQNKKENLSNNGNLWESGGLGTQESVEICELVYEMPTNKKVKKGGRTCWLTPSKPLTGPGEGNRGGA